MRQRRKSNRQDGTSPRVAPMGTKFTPTKIRVVSGHLRGRNLAYNGDPATRPMKQRTREAVFSLLGGKLPNTLAIDLFAGTGVLGIEAISRGSTQGILLEYSRLTMKTIIANIEALGISEIVEVKNVDTLRWLAALESHASEWPEIPWIVFCCPPYALWTKEREKFCNGISAIYAQCPSGSQLVCETDKTFDIAEACSEIEWDTREYAPAFISIARKP